MSPHVIQKLQIPEDNAEDGANDKVELQEDDDANDKDFLPDVLTSVRRYDYNVLIPQNHLVNFIIDNYVSKLCNASIHKREISFDRVGCTCNVFWSCNSINC
jgi:hypothetical protein